MECGALELVLEVFVRFRRLESLVGGEGKVSFVFTHDSTVESRALLATTGKGGDR